MVLRPTGSGARERMPGLRRAGLFGVVPLLVIAVAVFGWYRLSDTGRDWRYRSGLAGFCQGLVPEAESAVFTGHEKSGLGRDEHIAEDDGLRWERCDVADLNLMIGDVADTLANTGTPSAFFTLLHRGSDELPVALGGGWEGYTDLRNTAVVLPCANRPSSVLVSAVSREPLAGPPQARQVARLVTATAVRAARRYGCDARPGGPVPPVSRPDGETLPENVDGTCAGIPVATAVDRGEVNWIKKTDGGGNAPVEECVLGKTVAFSAAAYYLQANYGPYAQRLRTTRYDGGHGGDGYGLQADSGIDPSSAWATARCPGHTARALFFVNATEYAAPTKPFLRAALRAFAGRAAERHGCTDLRLPR
ncbi:hypothetical protein [Actinomadura coerulea]|uniref:hypothetical protein n=1 Tax=Actinomadura coerulea TaxID=46159 RepID=UPI00344279AD